VRLNATPSFDVDARCVTEGSHATLDNITNVVALYIQSLSQRMSVQ